ncbi:hypothetical protein BYI23_D014850 (plasmid) [Burkholderia sp. YI23]|nr:hypothetical protein BYI23_D014850 [Burkholderia sp. YI23]
MTAFSINRTTGVAADKRTLAGHRRSHFGLLSHFESIVYLDPEVSHGASNFCMAQEQFGPAPANTGHAATLKF